jgi:GT2 family glycosyltransferase
MGLVSHPALDRPERPTISVCIANYNGETLLQDCIGSVLTQNVAATVEIIVHDDASSDDSVRLLQARYPQVEVLASSENVGFCIANNRMVAHARGEYVLLLNNDAALEPDALRTLLEAANAGENGILTLPQFDWDSGALVDRGCLLDPFYNPVPNVDPGRRDVAYVIGACLWIPQSLWNDLGGFPEWMESIGEDLYLGCLARLRGHPVRALPTSGYRHRQGASFGGNRIAGARLDTTVRRRKLSERNKTAALLVCTPTRAAWLLLMLHVFALAIEGVVVSRSNSRERVWEKIYRPTFTSLRKDWRILRARREAIQFGRKSTLLQYLSCFSPWPRKFALLAQHGTPRVR